MKRLIVGLLTAGLLLLVAACGDAGGATGSSKSDSSAAPSATSATTQSPPRAKQVAKATARRKPAAPAVGAAASSRQLAPGEGKSCADALFKAVKPRTGENLSSNNGRELFVRATDAGHAHPEWKMSTLVVVPTETGFRMDDKRAFAYDFADKSRIVLHAESASGGSTGLVLTQVEIKR